MKYENNVLLVLFLVFLDQLSKFYFFAKNIEIFEYFSFNYVSNTGALFGWFKGYNFIFIILSLVVIGTIFYNYRNRKLRFGFDFILAGAFGNLIDRIFRGYVVDFVDFKVWPVFNLADAFVTVGVLILLYKMLKEKG